jgi:multidrug efflux system membrane fusion protein
VKPDDTVEVRPIKLGMVDGDRAAVIAGLAAGDVVVTEGGDRLRDGAKVTLPQASPAAATPAAAVPGAAPPPDAAPGKSSAPDSQGRQGKRPPANSQ